MNSATIYHYADDEGNYIGVDNRNLAKPSWVETTEPYHGAAQYINGSWDFSRPVRFDRDNALLELDELTKNALRWESLTETKKDGVRAYRQLLLDITGQAGFPDDVAWPTKPEW